MAEVIAFLDIEALCVREIRARLLLRGDAATVATRVPNPRPNRLVKVTRVGGPRKNIITDSPMVTFECWDTNEVAAASLVMLVRALVESLPWEDELGIRNFTEIGGPTYFEDPDSLSPRYQFTVEMDVRGHTI